MGRRNTKHGPGPGRAPAARRSALWSVTPAPGPQPPPRAPSRRQEGRWRPARSWGPLCPHGAGQTRFCHTRRGGAPATGRPQQGAARALRQAAATVSSWPRALPGLPGGRLQCRDQHLGPRPLPLPSRLWHSERRREPGLQVPTKAGERHRSPRVIAVSPPGSRAPGSRGSAGAPRALLGAKAPVTSDTAPTPGPPPSPCGPARGTGERVLGGPLLSPASQTAGLHLCCRVWGCSARGEALGGRQVPS